MEESFGIIPLRWHKEEWQVFLIRHKSDGHWGFPKGHRENKESAQESALRELKEETALELHHFLSLSPLEEKYSYIRKGEKIEKKVVYFPAVVQGEINLQKEEIAEGQWVFLREAQQWLTFAQSRSLLTQVEKILSKI